MSDLILGIDTSTRVCVGVARGSDPLVSLAVGDTRSHAELVTVTVRDALSSVGATAADVSQIVVGMGPGPYTGLRVGIAAAVTMGWALGVPVRRVCGLDVLGLAHAVRSGHGFQLSADSDAALVIGDSSSTALQRTASSSQDGAGDPAYVAWIDARRHEVYWAAYDLYGRRADGPHVGPPDSLPDLPRDDLAIEIDAGFMAARAAWLPDVGPEPLYLRVADATVSLKSKSALTPAERHV